MFVTGITNQQQGVKQKTYAAGMVISVHNAPELMGSARHQGLLRQLRGLVVIDDEAYARLYQTTLNNFAEFVQVMPRVVNGPLAQLLNEGIARALLIVKTYLNQNAAADPLVIYALFTAGLLRDVSRVVSNHKVVLAEKGGRYIDDWQPFAGSMVRKADYYKLYPLAPVYQRLENTITSLLARQLMPEEGFLWLASDLQLYADWLDVLSGYEGQGGIVSHALSLIRQDEFLKLLNALTEVPYEMLPAPDTQEGDLFFAWLKDGIEKGRIAVNTADAGVFITADGVFLERGKVFHSFAEASRLPVNINVVFSQFGNLFGIASKGGGDFMHAQYFSKFPTSAGGMAFSSPLSSQQRSLRSGVVVSDPAMIFRKSDIPAATNMLSATQARVQASHQLPSQQQQTKPTSRPK